MTEDLLCSCKIKQRMYFSMLKERCTINEYKQHKNNLTAVLRTAKRDYFANFIINHKQNHPIHHIILQMSLMISLLNWDQIQLNIKK